MSVYETSLILSDVFPGLSDLTLQDWTFGMCKCAANFLPLCISSPEVLSASPNLWVKKLQWCQKAALKSLVILRSYFACGVIQLWLKLVQWLILVCKSKNRKYFDIEGCSHIVIWICWRMVPTVGSGGCSIFMLMLRLQTYIKTFLLNTSKAFFPGREFILQEWKFIPDIQRVIARKLIICRDGWLE